MNLRTWLTKNWTLIVGILGWFYFLLVTIIYFNYISVLMLTGLTATGPTLILSIRKKNQSHRNFILRRRVLATGFALGLIALMFFPNIPRVPSQIHRRVDRTNTLVTPDNPYVEKFRDKLFDEYGGEDNFTNAKLRKQLDRLDVFTQEEITWTEDIRTRYMAGDANTPEEAIRAGKDDCRGQACVMASVLISMDIDAWVVEMAWHWWVMVYDDGKELKLNHDGRNNTTTQYPILMMWNDQEVRYIQDPIGLYNGVMISSPNFYRYLQWLGLGLITFGAIMGFGTSVYSSVCMGDMKRIFKNNKAALRRFKYRFIFSSLLFSLLTGLLVIFFFTPLFDFIGLYLFTYGTTLIVTLLNLEEINNRFNSKGSDPTIKNDSL